LPVCHAGRLHGPCWWRYFTQENPGTKANIAYLRHIVLDFENGELRPEELPNLFPGLRMVVTNTFNHSSDEPRFRALFPTSEIMTPEAYGLIQGCLADKLEDAGYSVDRGGKGRKGIRPLNSRPSGLNWSKSLPTSLFYLPCQAQTSRDSFFQDYSEGGRCSLQPAIWLQNLTFPLQPGFEVVQADVPPPGVDEVLVQSAKDIWRASKGQPGRGDEMFFKLAMSLRRAFVLKPSLDGRPRNGCPRFRASWAVFAGIAARCQSLPGEVSFVSQFDAAE